MSCLCSGPPGFDCWISLLQYSIICTVESFLLSMFHVCLCYAFCYVFLCLVFAMFLCASVYMCFVVTCWDSDDLLALVCGV